MDEEERHFFSLSLLLLRVGVTTLRHVFRTSWDNTPCYLPWTDCAQDGTVLVHLRNPRILSYEETKVHSGDTSTWDLSLIVKILLSTRPPLVARAKQREALEILRDLRNDLCHATQAKIAKTDFDRLWSEACNSLSLFGAKGKDFKEVKKDVKKTWQDLKPILKKWAKHDEEILAFLEHVHAKLDVLQKSQDSMLHGQSAMHQKQDSVLHGQAAMHQKQDSMLHGQAAMHQKQDSMLEAITRSQQQTDSNASRKSNDKDICKEISNFLKDYYQRGERALILPFPWMEGDRFHIKNIFTPTSVVDQNGISFISTTISSMSSSKRILIEGGPGMGKSTFCKKFVYDWSKNKNPNEPSNFDLVFLLNCRDFHQGNIWTAIKEQILPEELLKKEKKLFCFIKNIKNQERVLLIIDGYDEIPSNTNYKMKQSMLDLISGKLLSNCRVIVTSRPEKVQVLRKHFDKKLEIKGFSLLNDSCESIKRFFSSSPEIAEAAISSIRTVDAVRELVRSPLNAAFLCLVFEEKKEDRAFLESLDLCSLYHEIIFCVTKRYCVAKQGIEVDDGHLMDEFHDKYVELGKIALELMKNNCNNFDKNQLPSTCKQVLRDLGFLNEQKSLNKIRPTTSYSFLHSSIKEFFAALYIAEYLGNGDARVLMSILTFTAGPSATSVENCNHVQNVYYSLQRFNMVRMAHISSSTCNSLISSLVLTLPADVASSSSELTRFDFVFSFICELVGNCSDDQVEKALQDIKLPDVPLVLYLYNGKLAIKGMCHLSQLSPMAKISSLRLEGLEVVSTWRRGDEFEQLSKSVGRYSQLLKLILYFFISPDDFRAFFSHFAGYSYRITELNLSFSLYKDSPYPLMDALRCFKSLVHLDLSNSYISIRTCDCIPPYLTENTTLRTLKLCNCSLEEMSIISILNVLTKNNTLEEIDLSGNESFKEAAAWANLSEENARRVKPNDTARIRRRDRSQAGIAQMAHGCLRRRSGVSRKHISH